MFVTCYYDIYNKPEKFIEYLYLFYDLGISGLPITLFTDPSLVHKFRIFPSTVRVIGIPLAEFEIYKIAMNYNGNLPTGRSEKKDTKEFFGLMNAKIEFVKKAMEVVEDENFIWIDFGILKIMKDQQRVLDKLKEIHAKKYTKIMMPGCWEYGRPFSVDSIHWRFCGGFFIIPRKDVDRFYHHTKNVVTDFCTLPQYKLTWETNVWTVIESCAEKENIKWYSADHNDTIILNIDRVVYELHV